ncbi:uncharacterized protein YutE (UPF0331/DUF86 family) [Bacillus pakistanensis]|uniref:Uncharacterized protein YutE (UPF0331/DUF86 family) n=1 Tax=Rossellomorea pakistanensis TaxID=992288 RepID=A0ABS2NEG5_9BACI|nr:uncharacterized protein YutE (UPF0331/DUF86 family) [Bacillus pakistanensis]
MYFVDREKIEKTLQYMEQQMSLLEEKKQWHSPIEKLALERIGHVIIESILDVGNSMIDGFIMRDPGSYEDIIDILLDERVISEEMSSNLKIVISLRKPLVQEYISIDGIAVEETLQSQLGILKLFPKKVRTYLHDELGPVSAFKN